MGLLIAGAIIILWSFSRFARKPHAKTRNFIVFGIGATLWFFGIHAQAGIPGVLISITRASSNRGQPPIPLPH